MRNKLREILNKCESNEIHVKEVKVRQGKHLGRFNYMIKTRYMEIIYSTLPNSIFPNYIVVDGEKLHDIDEEVILFIEAWEKLVSEMDVELEMVENVI